MIRSKGRSAIMVLLCLTLMNCATGGKKSNSRFDSFNRTVEVANWQYGLRVENLSDKMGKVGADLKDHYLKATVYASNVKTKKSLLYSVSKDMDDYEVKYKYLSFGGNKDLYIKHNDEYIYPIGYVFEPSNGLSSTERLVYKFQISDDLYTSLMQTSRDVEYWYVDRIAGLGKICFKQQ